MTLPPYTESMTQEATYWPPGANDGFGGRGVLTPVPIACRWQDDAQLFRTPEGREAVSRAVVYTSQPVALGGYLLLGRSDSDVLPPGAEEIRQIGVSPSLGGTEALYKAFV